MTINIYANGLCHCSVCAPADMQPSEVEIAVNNRNPTGIRSQWKISDEDFKTGEKNGFECECNGMPTRHWLMVC